MRMMSVKSVVVRVPTRIMSRFAASILRIVVIIRARTRWLRMRSLRPQMRRVRIGRLLILWLLVVILRRWWLCL